MSELRERYEIQRELGRGGMGRVLVARHRELGTFVAVKRLATERNGEDDVARFRREARIVAGLKHPNIVSVFDSGADDEGPYMVMELLEGEDLANKLHRERLLSEPEALEILSQVSEGLLCAHAAGLVHRDIKPANIFLATESWSNQPVVKVLDFGIAKALKVDSHSTTLTVDGALRGSPAYMSPEQVWGQAVDQRTDVWALAVVTYEILTGEHPFKAEAVGDTLARICSSNYVPPSRLRPALSHWDAFFARCLAVRREGRFATVQELVAAVSELTQTQPATAAPTPATADQAFVATGPTRPRRAWRFALIGVVTASVLVALTLGVRRDREDSPTLGSAPPPRPEPVPAASIGTVSEAHGQLASAAVATDPPKKVASPPKRPTLTSNPSASSNTVAKPAASGRRDPFTGLIETP